MPYHINDLLPLGMDLTGVWLERTLTKTMKLCTDSDTFYHRRYLKERVCIPQFDGGSAYITCQASSYTELDNCRSSDCQALSCLNVCGGPCDATNGTCSTMQDLANNRVLNFYERSKCVADV